MGRGRGNLRENRKDPAPTVGICGDIIAIQMLPLPPPCHTWRPGFYNDAARRVATVFEKWDCEINPDKRLNHTGLFPCLPFWNTAVYNPFSRFPENVATRRAASLSSFTPPTYRNLRSLSRCVVPRRNKNHTSPCVAWYAAWRRWQWAALGAMRIALPTVGAGSSQREDSPAHRLPHRPHRRILSRASATPIYTPWLG